MQSSPLCGAGDRADGRTQSVPDGISAQECGNEITVAVFLTSNDERRRFAGIIQPPGIAQRPVEIKKVAQARVEPSPNVGLGNRVAALSHAIGDAIHRQIGTGKP